MSTLSEASTKFAQQATDVTGAIQTRMRDAGAGVVKLMVLKDLLTALSVGGMAFLAYGLYLLFASVLPLAAAAILTSCVFGLALFLAGRRSGGG